MIEQKKIRNRLIAVTIIGVVLTFIIEYFPLGRVEFPVLKGHRGFYENLAMGIMGSAAVSALISHISYVDKRNEVINKFFKELLSIGKNLKMLMSDSSFSEFSHHILVREADYSVARYEEIIKSCSIIREEINLKNIKLSDDYIKKVEKAITEVGQYSTLINRDIRCSSDDEHLKRLLNGINHNVTMHFGVINKLLIEYGLELNMSLKKRKVQQMYESELNKIFESIK